MILIVHSSELRKMQAIYAQYIRLGAHIACTTMTYFYDSIY
jgi:hypothetical protein